MERRLTFDQNVIFYDKHRPTYGTEIYKDVLEYSDFGPGKRAVEVGCGTGQATRPFLDTGGHVIVCEIGKNLAEYTSHKFADYSNLDVKVMPFEDCGIEESTVDLVYAATAFHWVGNGDGGYPLARKMLKPGGTLACWWNNPCPMSANPTLYRELQYFYKKYAPQLVSGYDEDSEKFEKWYIKRCVDINSFFYKYGYKEVQFKMYYTHRTFSANDYFELLHTYSDHMNVPEEQRVALFDSVRDTIEKYGSITIKDRIDLHMGSK